MADSNNWNNQEYAPGTGYSPNGLPGNPKDPALMSLSYLKGLSGAQKNVTRDGQPAKRRGPKPDAKPAQTRRQELNRQAQRTHRERKEQYIKLLEIELSRLKETFVQDSNAANVTLEQHKLMLKDQRQENEALREILISRGINNFQSELETRKAAISMRPKREESVLSNLQQRSPLGQNFQNLAPPPPSSTGYSAGQEQGYRAGKTHSSSSHSPSTMRYSHSPASQQDYPDYNPVKREFAAVPAMPKTMIGIFETDPQLGVDFILQLEKTCRDHGEYLVRRSIGSPDDPEEALFSGHALMASCPPPSHISKTPAVQGGLVPTYDHKTPDAATVNILNNLLNLGQTMKAGGFIPGGQVTPIMALQSLKGHRNYTILTREDVLGMIESVRSKVRCYGFGAVMEDFELRDALSGIFATKPETYESLPDDYNDDDIDGMYG